MRIPFRRSLIALAGLAFWLSVAEPALACPMCKAAAESDPRLPNAFMASILFMLAMPFAIATSFGIAFYRLSKKAPQAVSERPSTVIENRR